MKYTILLILLTTSCYAFTAKQANRLSNEQASLINIKKQSLEIALLKKDRLKITKAIVKAAKGGVFTIYLTCDRIVNKNGDYFRSLGYQVTENFGSCFISW